MTQTEQDFHAKNWRDLVFRYKDLNGLLEDELERIDASSKWIKAIKKMMV